MPKKKADSSIARCVFAEVESLVCPPVEDVRLPLCKTHRADMEQAMEKIRQGNRLREGMSEKGGDAFVFNPQSGAVYALNTTGAFLVKEIISGKDALTIVEDFLQSFAVDSRAAIAKDMLDFLREMQKTDLITQATADACR